jgi:hypothetical protein
LESRLGAGLLAGIQPPVSVDAENSSFLALTRLDAAHTIE